MSLNEIKNDAIVENPLDLTADQSSSLSSVRSSLGSSYDRYTDFTLVRFLRSQSWNVEAAAKAFKDYLQWREEKKLDTILDTEPAKVGVMKALTPYAYHGFDVDGRPVYIEKCGKMACYAAADESIITGDEFENAHMWGVEYLMKLAYESGLKRGKRVDTFVSIIDMDGLGFQHRAVFHLLKRCLDMDNKYFPERIGRLYIVNTPWIAPHLFQLAAPFFDEVTKARLHVVDDMKTFLPTVIPPSQLPVEYGGTCSCPGMGCVPQYDAAEFIAKAKEREEEGLEKENVAYDFEHMVECNNPSGGAFSWYFTVADGYDIDFSVEWRKEGWKEGDEKVWVKPVSRVTNSKGQYDVKEKGKLVLRWDNNFSWMNSKDIKYLATYTDTSKLGTAGYMAGEDGKATTAASSAAQ